MKSHVYLFIFIINTIKKACEKHMLYSHDKGHMKLLDIGLKEFSYNLICGKFMSVFPWLWHFL